MNKNIEQTNFYLKNGVKAVIREPNEQDAEKMVRFFNEVGGETDNLLFGKDEFSLSVDQEKEHILSVKMDDNSLILLCCVDNEIIANAQLISCKRSRIAHNSEVSLSVKKKYWGMGIGYLLMKEIIKFAKSDSNTIKNVCLGVNSNNKYAIKLYEKLGFEMIGIHRDNIYVNGIYIDEVLMDLNL